MREKCNHPRFDANVVVNRIEHPTKGLVYMADVQVRCMACGTRFKFKGLQHGLSFTEPMVDPAGFELRAPLEPDAHLTSLLAMHADSRFPYPPASPGA